MIADHDRSTAPSDPAIPDVPNSLPVLSYLAIRRAIGWSGLALPVVLGPIGYFGLGIELQDNMSRYYYTPLRDVFVGTLCAIGVFLFCYRGYGWIENWSANLGAVGALGIALFPIDPTGDPLYGSSGGPFDVSLDVIFDGRSLTGLIHSAGGALFFGTLALYSLYHFPTREHGDRDVAAHVAERNLVYYSSGITILLATTAMGIYLILPTDLKAPLDRWHFLLWGEWVAVWAFASAWLAKGRMILSEIGIEIFAAGRRRLLGDADAKPRDAPTDP